MILFGSNASAQLQMPSDLYDLANQINCGSVENFYDRPGMVEPPFLYGYKSGFKEDSVVFWCKEISNNGAYLLVFAENVKIIHTINWNNYPGGLSLVEKRNYDLSRFKYVNNRNVSGPDLTVEATMLQSEYDGVITYFYEYNGEWLYKILH